MRPLTELELIEVERWLEDYSYYSEAMKALEILEYYRRIGPVCSTAALQTPIAVQVLPGPLFQK